jgi:adenylate cyclase
MRLRPVPVVALLALKTALYGAVFIASIGLARAIFYVVAPAMPMPVMQMFAPSTIALSFGLGFGLNFLFVLRTILGPRTLAALVTGRYQQPRVEERIVMFLDLHGSTPLAERLGDVGFHRFLNRVFFDITDPVLESGGEIYRYVGDEIIISWRAAKAGAAARAIECLFAITDALDARRGQYVAEFGAAAQLRGAIHQGPLIVGEMGDVKREIVMIGDTMNTASRIEGACRTTGCNAIASAPLIRAAVPLPAGIKAESLGPLELRGKGDAIELFALSRA